MNYYTKWNLIIIRKHILLLLFRSLKVVMYLAVAWLLYWLTIKYRVEFWEDLIKFLLLPTILIIVNFAFLKLTLYIIQHYNNLLIFYNDHLVVIKSSFILIDDIEILDVYKVTKIDTFTRWIMANMFWYWTVIVEQTRDEVRKFSFIPDPQRTLWLFREQKDRILDQRAKVADDSERVRYFKNSSLKDRIDKKIMNEKDKYSYNPSIGNVIRQIKRDTNDNI